MPSESYLIGLAVWLVILAALLVLLLHLRRARRRAKRSTRIVDAGLGLWFALVVLTIPELWFAFVYDATDSFSQTNVSQKWFARHVVANEAGYRDDRELPRSRERGVTYIGFVGDSFTFGHGIRRTADRFSDCVGKELERRFENSTRVFNTGIPGVDIRSLADEIVPELIRSHTPVDVLVYVFVPNDIELLDERTGEFYRAQQSGSPKFWVWRHTYFYNWLYHRVRILRSGKSGDYFGYLAESYTGPPWQRFAAKLGELHRQCTDSGIELRVVMFPFLSTLGADDPFAPAYDGLASYCAEHEIPCLDLRPVLAPHVAEGLVVNRFDAHPNERAHELAAEAIFADLTPVVAVRAK